MVPCSGLPAGGALGRRLQAVVGGVAHHVGERILDQVEHLAVELGVGAVHLQFDLLAEFAGEVAHDARQLLPGIADRLHPRLHDAFLQLGGDVGQPLQRHLELGVLVAPGDLQQLVAGQHQFRHHRHQMFQRVHVDADRLVGDLVGLLHFDLDGRLRPRALLAAGLASLRCGRALLPARARPAAGAGCGATSIAVSRNARSSSSSDTSPGRSGRSSVCGTRRALRQPRASTGRRCRGRRSRR